MSWSREQWQAITTRGKNVLVAAAAGSGKTSVLVERIIKRVLDEEQPLDIDRLLVVTFTNAAAAEMRSRIGNALSEALKESPYSRHLERQLALLNAAAISTIHAFCQSVIRQNFHLLELDPKFRVAGEAETALLRIDVMEKLFERRYNEEDEDFLQFVEHYGSGNDDTPLYQLLLELYTFSRSHPWPGNWLEHLPDAFCLPEGTDLEDTPWSVIIREKVILELEQAGQQLAVLCREVEQPGQPDVYLDAFLTDQELLRDLIAAAGQSWQELSAALSRCQFVKLPPVKGVDKVLRDYYQKGRQKVKDAVKQIQELYFGRPDRELLADMCSVAPLMRTLSGLVQEFDREFQAAKQARGIMDFNDLEHFCLAVLLDRRALPGQVRPSPVAAALREKYVEIMVDEYQDTNGVQETILRLLARESEPSLFLVGDVKQSIYRFRLAEPQLFLEKYRQYPVRSENCLRIDLAQNFRSRAGILHAVNFLFCQIMTPRVAELEYGDAEKLNPGPDYPATDRPVLDGPVELCLIDREQDEPVWTGQDTENQADMPAEEEEVSAFELEARLIARRIGEYMESGYQVYDKQDKVYRPLHWRDIVILLRSVKNKAGLLLDVLKKAGIPVYAEVDGGYFREIEVQVMLSLLSVIDNPRQDIHLAAVLRSPLVGLTVEELARVRLAESRTDLWTAISSSAGQSGLSEALQHKIRQFIKRLETWRDVSRRKGVPDLIWQLYRDTGYYEYVGGMPGGLLRQANLRALYDRARQYEATNFRGLFRFLRFLERMQDKGTDLAVARALGEGEDVVRVMSIHKSKGLEFPLVFLADLGKQINLQDSRGLLLCHKTLGVGPFVIRPELRYRYPTLARQAIAHQLNMETKAEEMRILYVALTRAREKLILVGSANKLAARAKNWCQSAGHTGVVLPDGVIAGAKTYLDWICPALARHPAGSVLRQLAQWEGEPADAPVRENPSQWTLWLYSPSEITTAAEETVHDISFLEQVKRMQPVAENSRQDEVKRRLNWCYPYASAVGKPAKLSVTEIKRRFETQADADGPAGRLYGSQPAFVRPRFLAADGKMTAAEQGTLMHTVMQHVDYQSDVSPAGIARQLESMVRRFLLLPEQVAAVNCDAVSRFFAGSLGQRMRSSPCVRRELPFSLVLPASEFYPEIQQPDGIFIQGIIDVLFNEPDGLVLVDYKTDRGKSGVELADRYQVQLALYARAISSILQIPVKEKYFYAFYSGETIPIE
ncbi:ATP-dependent helicase/nuclease subunit A [Propionispora sp. 2/2-37]|uniref:helicase-exonuclease AddAB subunit AddA n=1 Tax=Propionispora sp. 2/2-37 TaxID=1677858 RepID=UPI0006BB71DB|nr:helicase-exonuclease AddAB subunit AddA [Propionispora sp. 2/2-37]CUH95724.1 ATP-dependent helicase/nuclease subunit A [Propionispora sp. 2/2-37]